MTFTFHRIPVGICNCYLLRGEQTVLIDGGAQGNVKAFVRGMDFPLVVMHKEIADFGRLHPRR